MESPPLTCAFLMENVLGWETYLENWKALFPRDRGVEPLWLVPDRSVSKHPLLRLPGLPKTIRLRLNNLLRVRELLAHSHYDALFTHSAYLNLLPASCLRKPVYCVLDATQLQLRGFGGVYGNQASLAPVERWKHRSRVKAYGACAGHFPLSTWTADSLVKDYQVQAKDIHVYPSGVRMDLWDGPSTAQPDKPVVDVLFVGGDFERKGGNLLLSWAMNAPGKNWRLHLVTRQVPEFSHPQVRFHTGLSPNSPRLRELYRSADLFAIPTKADCSSIVVQEAAICGVPSIATAVGGIPELIEDGATGFLVPPGDSLAFAERMNLLVGNASLRRALGHAARRKAEREFDFQLIARNIVDIIARQAPPRR